MGEGRRGDQGSSTRWGDELGGESAAYPPIRPANRGERGGKDVREGDRRKSCRWHEKEGRSSEKENQRIARLSPTSYGPKYNYRPRRGKERRAAVRKPSDVTAEKISIRKTITQHFFRGAVSERRRPGQKTWRREKRRATAGVIIEQGCRRVPIERARGVSAGRSGRPSTWDEKRDRGRALRRFKRGKNSELTPNEEWTTPL